MARTQNFMFDGCDPLLEAWHDECAAEAAAPRRETFEEFDARMQREQDEQPFDTNEERRGER